MGAEVTAMRRKAARTRAVTPAKAGAHLLPWQRDGRFGRWVPAFAGMTEVLR